MSDELKDARGAQKGSFGNVAHERTDERARQVEELAKLQVTQAEIATVMGISADTIQRHYSEEFARGRAAQGIKLREHAYTLAYGKLKNIDKPDEGHAIPPDGQMTRFLLERQFGMVEKRDNHHTIGDVSPEAAEWLGRKPRS